MKDFISYFVRFQKEKSKYIGIQKKKVLEIENLKKSIIEKKFYMKRGLDSV